MKATITSLVWITLMFGIVTLGQDKTVPDKSPETVQVVSPSTQKTAVPDKPDQSWKEEYQQAVQLAGQIDAAKKAAGIDHLESLLAELETDLQKHMGPGKKYDPTTDTFVPDKAEEKK